MRAGPEMIFALYDKRPPSDRGVNCYLLPLRFRARSDPLLRPSPSSLLFHPLESAKCVNLRRADHGIFPTSTYMNLVRVASIGVFSHPAL